MRRLKSKRLRRPRKITEAGLERAADILLSSRGWIPEPQMDWGAINEAKITICHQCLNFDSLLGGCKFHLIPNKGCKAMKLDKA